MPDEINLDNIVNEATMLPDNEQAKYIQEQTGNKTELVEQATLLLQQKHNEQTVDNSFANIDVKIGDRIGPYHILDELGDGGMGKVFLVEQKKPIQRRVALKIIKLGMDTKDVLARFEMERQALALMSHPNVAAVIDAGVTDSGRPYFVMEYVPGLTISGYADQYSLTIKQRIGLVIQACRGVLHAHQKGILHRDLKPGNILVTEKDGEPLVKIIDFGVAKSTQQRLVNETVYTQLGVFIGTPNYTSPEQAGASPLDVDTRTDVYSLGVILYELMVGKLPFDPDTFHNKSLGEVQLIIKEKQAPSPYDRLKTTRFAHKHIAKQRKSSFGDLKKTIKGDLSCIIMRAIEKDRIERYPTVSALESDLQRYLEGLPVEAQPHTVTYRTIRFIGRHKFMVGSIFSIVLALTSGLIATFMALKHAELETLNAKRQSVHSTAVSVLMTDLLLNTDPRKKNHRKNITLRQVIIDLEEKLDKGELLKSKRFDELKELGMEPSLLWSLREDLSSVHLSMNNYELSKKNLVSAIQLRKQNAPDDWLEIVKLELTLSARLVQLDKINEAETLFLQSIAKLDPPKDKEQAKVLLYSGIIFTNFNTSLDKIEHNRKLLKVSQDMFGDKSEEYAKQLLNLSKQLYDDSDPKFLQEAIDLVIKSQVLARGLTPPDTDLESNAKQTLVLLLTYSPRQEQAILEAKNLVQWTAVNYGDKHMNTINAQSLLINAYFTSGSAKNALAILEDIEPIILNSEDLSNLYSSEIFINKSTALLMLGRYKEGLTLSETGLMNTEREDYNLWSTSILDMISEHAYFLGELEKSESSIKKSISSDPNDLDFNKSFRYSKLAEIYLSNNELEKAMQEAKKSLKLSLLNSSAHSILAHIAFQNKNSEEAIKQFKMAEKVYKDNFGIMGEGYLLHVSNLVLILSLTGNAQEALAFANSIEIGESETVYASVIRLSIMAAKVASGQNIDQQHAKQLFELVNSHWSKKIFQYKYASNAAEFIGILK
jgi:serine/threonine protein kinase